jgi:pSer/pThr/pTyr-binding forkhead associated (FHA) protein/outer membrane protein assembly factor BamB
MPKLIVKHKTEVVSQIELTPAQQRFTVGSQEDNDLILQDASVATHHVRIEKHIENYRMVDLGSAAGTTLNGRPVKNQMQLVDGDEISVGEHSIVFESETFGFGLRQYQSPEQLHDITATIDAISGPDSHLLDGVNTDTQTIAAEAPAGADYYEFEDLSDNQQDADSNSSDDNGGVQEKTQYCLVAIHGPYTGKKYPLKFGDTKLGRDTSLNDIIIQRDARGEIDPSISRRHATVRYHNGRFHVSDKRSKTRTYVNQIKLSTNERIPLLERDELEIVSDQTSTILRLLPESEYDCAPPAKAGTWWIRNRLKTGAAVAMVFMALSLITLTSIMVATRKQRARPTELTFTPEVWYRPATTLAADGHTRAQLALADLNGDGSVDVVTSDATGNLLALDGPSKGELWRKNNTYVDPAIPITLADINTNGLSDILFAGQDGRLHALDGQSGAEMWVSPILGDLISPAAVGDFDRNGIRDVVMCTKSGRIFIAYNIIIAPEWHSLDTGTPVHSTPALADVDDDGIQEIFIGSDSGKLLVIRAAEAKIEVVTDLQATVRKIAGDQTTQHPIVMPPSFGDLNNDGVTDIIVAAASGHHLAIEGSNGRPIWHAYLPDQRVSRAWHLAQPLVARFNDDDIPDVVIVAGNRVQVVTGTENKLHRKPIAWQQDLDELATTVRQIVLADFDKDGNQDIVLAAEDNEIFILNGATGDFLARFRNTKGIEIISPLVIADLDGTGFLSILFCVPGHRIYRIRTSSPIARNGIVWAQAYHDARHSGTYDYAAPGSGSQYALAVLLACMSVMTGLLTTRAKRQRANLIYRNQKAG